MSPNAYCSHPLLKPPIASVSSICNALCECLQLERALPPWRSAEAMLSKWAPAQLLELRRTLRCQQGQQGAAGAGVSTPLTAPEGNSQESPSAMDLNRLGADGKALHIVSVAQHVHVQYPGSRHTCQVP